MNTIRKENKEGYTLYTLRGPLNKTSKTKLKNSTSKILNNSNNPRNLSSLHLTPDSSTETIEMFNQARIVKPDLQAPAVQVAVLENRLNTNILTNSKTGTYIKEENKNKHFKNIGRITTTFKRSGYFLRKGVGAKLLEYVIEEQKRAGVKTILIHPDNPELEGYYAKFGFKPLTKVPLLSNRSRNKIFYESYGLGRLMYMAL